jgi:hypothetical protein
VFTCIFEENDIYLALVQSFAVIGLVALWKPIAFYLHDRRNFLDDLAVLEAPETVPFEPRKGTTTVGERCACTGSKKRFERKIRKKSSIFDFSEKTRFAFWNHTDGTFPCVRDILISCPSWNIMLRIT